MAGAGCSETVLFTPQHMVPQCLPPTEHFSQCFPCCCCSATKLHLTLCNPINCSLPGFPVLHHLPEFAQLMSIESVIPSNHLSLCLLFLSSVFPSIRVFSNESVLHIRWPKYWSFSFSTSPSNEQSGLISLKTNWPFFFFFFFLRLTGLISLPSKGLSRVFSNTIDQKHQFFSTQLSL